MKCTLCPRHCGVDRQTNIGFCGVRDTLRIARADLHRGEEPCLWEKNGAGAVFFSGCNLRCVFCQNYDVSHASLGYDVTPSELCAIILDLQDKGAECIDLVTPTQYTDVLCDVLKTVKSRLTVPVVWNCGGYESVDTLRKLDGLVDIYLPDCKFYDDEIARKYASVGDYFAVSCDAISEMLRQVGAPSFDGEKLTHGVLVRHLVLPGCRQDSIALLKALNARFGRRILLSLMHQYTPDFAEGCPYPNLHRRLTAFEYDSVLKTAEELGFDGYMQQSSSSTKAETPEFFGTKLI